MIPNLRKWGGLVGITLLGMAATPGPVTANGLFERIATIPVFEVYCEAKYPGQNPLTNGCADNTVVSEIVTATGDGNTLIYTDAAQGNVGFVDITVPAAPKPDGIVEVGGEPTSVAVAGGYALVAVNTSKSFTNPKGSLRVIDIAKRNVVRTIPLKGQPDSIAVSPDGLYAAVVIENERDEDLGDGSPPQLPSGFLVIVDLAGKPAKWKTRTVALAGFADKFPTDAEPEFVDINEENVAAVTLQENNYIVLVDLPSGNVTNQFSAGTVDLEDIDVVEDDIITLDGSLTDVPREPDAVAWLGTDRIVTADEGDLEGGSRGFTIFDTDGNVEFSSGNALEHLTVRIGHYPEGRSENKGNEPEGVEVATFGGEEHPYIFVNSERSSVIFVYEDMGPDNDPEFVQTLPASGIGPEGSKAIPDKNLFVVASEDDSRADKFRSSITIYQKGAAEPTYPTIESVDVGGKPIPWAALSALAADRTVPGTLYTVHDSFFIESRIYKVDVSGAPAVIFDEIVLNDGALGTYDYDLEGLVQRSNDGFWAVSEGAGSVDDPDRPVESKDLLLEIANDGQVLQEVQLPDAVNNLQRRFGFEGVTVTGTVEGNDELVYVAFQREWVGDPAGKVRIGRYDPNAAPADRWTFFYYPLDTPTSPNGGWVGLSEIVSLDDGDNFAVVERDNQGGPDATIKKIYKFSINGLAPMPQGSDFPELTKQLVLDLIPHLLAPKGVVIEKVEGLTKAADDDVFIVTDNDGVDDSTGETQLINLHDIFD